MYFSELATFGDTIQNTKPTKILIMSKNLSIDLVKKGYLDSIEYQDGKQSIYYLTEQYNDIAIFCWNWAKNCSKIIVKQFNE